MCMCIVIVHVFISWNGVWDAQWECVDRAGRTPKGLSNTSLTGLVSYRINFSISLSPTVVSDTHMHNRPIFTTESTLNRDHTPHTKIQTHSCWTETGRARRQGLGFSRKGYSWKKHKEIRVSNTFKARAALRTL